ncbi:MULTISPECIES: TIGR00266 family protein [unclassified Saccharopolyspora]|uniref:TIGR00266 family protein n=1 Tax=unclassified Saccharopolyspora TaxID=2646250 RepID=UPI001CD3D687|nr:MULTISPECIES: TIGR00266 family protein [unclassified Saccharopolyspora]MCA1186397.1 TIGR00266 family protein [Saccharopolyspora sp. 6T]MCA1193513.1 TIGR00266 family protein [Saccharopolyspora sp. 6V]MCA1228226.1 TIGR00266 family protein [Saccharopolyspora sp. 6M]MCA1282548.1 TIGR00266 family protein [Saccharopolyspora sp. 7B]
MQVRNRHTPSFGVSRLLLAPGEPVRIASGALLATSYGVAVEVRGGGLLKSLAKGRSAAVTTCTAGQQGGWVDVAPALPGDLHVLEPDGQGWCVTGSAWLASASGVRFDEQWAGFKNLFGGERGFLGHVSGQGPVVLACCGALDVMTLQPGEFLTVSPGHVVAYGDAVQTRLRQLGQGVAQSLKTGEGLVFDFAGPGQVLVQTRDPRSMVGWLHSQGFGAPRS